MKKLLCSDSKTEILLDDDWHDMLKFLKWRVSKSGYVGTYNHDKIKNKTTHQLIHRLIMDANTTDTVDHINRVKTDNRRCNLRLCSLTENLRNSARKNPPKSGLRGVSIVKGKNGEKYRACISVDNKEIYLGTFLTKKEAATAYNQAAIKYHKDFSVLNEISLF